MTTDAEVREPSPRSGTAGRRADTLALLAAPAAWSVAHVVTYSVATVGCYPGHEPRSTAAGLGWVSPLLIAIYVVGLVVAGASGVAAYHTWAALHGDERRSIRRRFLSLWGMLTSGTFLVLIAFDTIALLMVPLCSH